ncbi:adenylate/guanylate cyclase domain-containing protein [Paenibacillus chartarius]|uniref:Adenylate/guanylate cyclase domain-containing protein n=1 Tax=Paenibacillus chartarius TaxID=747481 RepID=A0ABV6DPT8_9BACL
MKRSAGACKAYTPLFRSRRMSKGIRLIVLCAAAVYTVSAVVLIWASPDSASAVAAMAASGAFAIAVGAVALVREYRRRFARPLQEFHTALEDLAEGFLTDAVPYERLRDADPRIVRAFEQVLDINRMMSRTVDNLEQGYEEERLAKLHQEALTRAYERFVPHEFISFLSKKSIIDVRLGDHVEAELTVLFSDIRSFTTMSEQLTTQETFKLLNAYLRRMDPVVKRHGGFIDKYIGDGVMALFQAEADRAVQAAVDMMRELETYNLSRAASGYAPIRAGIGLNTGPLMLGIVGGESRMEGTVISDSVNVASRVEELNKRYAGTSILIAEGTYRRLKRPERFAIRRIDEVSVKGRKQQLAIYEVFDADPAPLCKIKLRTRSEFERAVELFHSDDAEGALRLFEACAAAARDDAVAGFYIEKCQQKLRGER